VTVKQADMMARCFVTKSTDVRNPEWKLQFLESHDDRLQFVIAYHEQGMSCHFDVNEKNANATQLFPN
jgi:hypothetical protein